MSTKSGCECIAHILQLLTEMNPRAAVVSVDGISAYDLASRHAMLQGLMDLSGGNSALPFVSVLPCSFQLFGDCRGKRVRECGDTTWEKT